MPYTKYKFEPLQYDSDCVRDTSLYPISIIIVILLSDPIKYVFLTNLTNV